MSTINQAYINALLADAAYRSLSSAMTSKELSDELSSRMTESQATFIAANFKVKDSVETLNTINPMLGTGFDAVVWEGKDNTPYAGQVYVSMRGTQGGTDIADDLSLASKGIPYDQIRDMVNWWLKNTASTSNTNVVQIKVADIPGQVVGKTFALDVPTAGTGLLEALDPITGVNGHSLGGYLATAFTRLFGNGWAVQAVNTFNSAGFSNLMTSNTDGEFSNIANMIGASNGMGSWSAVGNKQTNFHADNGWSVTTNAWGEMGFLMPGFEQYGARTALNQEDLLTGDLGAPINNHAMYKLTDLLALGAALENLDPTLTVAQLNGWIKAGSNDMKASYEGLLDGLRRALFGNTITATPVSDNADSPERTQYHANLKNLVDATASPGGALQALQGKIALSVATTSLATTAKTDFAAFLCLNALSPVVLSTSDPAATAALKAANPTLASAWTADSNARLYGDTTKVFDYSDNWYSDRAAMLNLIVLRNQSDQGNQVAGAGNPVLYSDAASGTTVQLGLANPALVDISIVRFGSDGDDAGAKALNGGAKNDHLYGMAGNDTLNGLVGNDYLEGGSGTDTYQFTGTWGSDTVLDSDGLGTIQIDGITLMRSCFRISCKRWRPILSPNKFYK